MRKAKWIGAAAGLVVVGVLAFGALALGGAASAQEPGAKAGRYQELLAQKLGVSVDTLRAAAKEARDKMIDEAVAAGNITAEQAEKLKSNDLGALRGGGFERFRDRVHHVVGNIIDAAADVIGIDSDTLKTRLREGESLTDIAAEQNVSRDQLKAGLESALEAQIAEALADGTITQEQADRLNEALDARIDQAIDHEGGMKAPGMQRPGGEFRGRPFFRGDRMPGQQP